MKEKQAPIVPTVDKLPTNATLTDVVNKNIEVKNKINACKSKLAYILTNKNLYSSDTEKMSDLIEKINNLSEYIPPIVYGIKVNEDNSNPETCCTYIEQAIGINPANSTSLGGWEDKWPFNKIRIVGFKNGQVVKEIKKDRKDQYIDGTTVSNDVDVMVEIPKIYWNFTNIENGYELRISDTKINNGYDCYAHKVSGIEKDFIYVGAYLGSVRDNTLHSRCNSSPSRYISLADFRTYAHNVGEGYQQMNWFTLLLLQILYLIAYKNLNSQEALGYGYVNYNNNINVIQTGGTLCNFIYGEKDGCQQMCFLGIEDLWGNADQWIDGIKIDDSYNILISQDNKTFNDNASGYKNIDKFISTKTSGMMSKIIHTDEAGFFPKEFNGSHTTYCCDYGDLYSNSTLMFGGNYMDTYNSGIFSIKTRVPSDSGTPTLSSRLIYLG